MKAVRNNRIVYLVKCIIAFVVLIFFIDVLVSAYYWYPYYKDGQATVDQLFETVLLYFRGDTLWNCLYAIMIAILGIYLVIYIPLRQKRRINEMHPNGLPLSYDFYDDSLVVSSVTQAEESSKRIKYADVRRKIREAKHTITLTTGQKNMLTLYKSIMTPDEAKQIMALLKVRCPQHR